MCKRVHLSYECSAGDIMETILALPSFLFIYIRITLVNRPICHIIFTCLALVASVSLYGQSKTSRNYKNSMDIVDQANRLVVSSPLDAFELATNAVVVSRLIRTKEAKLMRTIHLVRCIIMRVNLRRRSRISQRQNTYTVT